MALIIIRFQNMVDFRLNALKLSWVIIYGAMILGIITLSIGNNDNQH